MCVPLCVAPRWPSVWGALVFHQTTRRRDNNTGGRHWSFRCRKERSSQLIQWYFSRAQGNTHLHIEHSRHPRQVSVWGGGGHQQPCFVFLSAVSVIMTVKICMCFSLFSDSGEYHCTSTPWYLSASTGAWTQATELTSTRIFLTVRFAGEECLPDISHMNHIHTCFRLSFYY